MRLVTIADADDQVGEEVGISAVLALELDDGERVPLLTDRGWAGSQTWEETRVAEVEETTRMIVGPDEPLDDLTPQDMEAGHWAHLERAAREHGVDEPGQPAGVAAGDPQEAEPRAGDEGDPRPAGQHRRVHAVKRRVGQRGGRRRPTADRTGGDGFWLADLLRRGALHHSGGCWPGCCSCWGAPAWRGGRGAAPGDEPWSP